MTQSSVMKKTWRRSWQCSKVRTGGFPCPLSLTVCSEPDYFPQHLDLTSLRFSAKYKLLSWDGCLPPCLWDLVKLPGEVFSTQAFVLLSLAGQGLVTLQTSCLAAAVTAKPAVWAKPWGAAKEDGFCLVTQQADWRNGPCNSWTPSPFFFFFNK